MAKRARSAAGDDRSLDLGTDKLYFKIGEVAEIVGVAPYVLRYWESEFRTIRPRKSRAQQRVYRRQDVEVLLKVKRLLYVEKFTIAGAKLKLRESAKQIEPAPVSNGYLVRQSLDRVRSLFDETVKWAQQSLRDPAAADPARFLRDAGGASGLLEPVQTKIIGRPPRCDPSNPRP